MKKDLLSGIVWAFVGRETRAYWLREGVNK